MQKLADGVYAYITEGYTMMSNAGLVVGEKCAVAFDSLTSLAKAKEFRRCCEEVTDKPIRYLVFSHSHGDHTLGSGAFTDAVQIAQRDSEPFFAKESRIAPEDRWESKRFPWVDFTGSYITYPDLFIDRYLRLDLGGRYVEIFSDGACHTPEDLYMVVPDANVVFCGDLFFAYVCPNGRPHGFPNWPGVMQKLIDMDARYVPGHGPVCDKRVLEKQKKFMEYVLSGADAVEAGEDLDAVVDRMDLSEYVAAWREPGRIYADIQSVLADRKGEQMVIKNIAERDRILNEKILIKYGKKGEKS